MPEVVVDANLVVTALVPREQDQVVDAQFDTWRRTGTELWVPPHFFPEVTSTFRRKVVQRELTEAQGDRAFADLNRFPVRLFPTPPPFDLAWELAKRYRLPVTYDVEYMAVAQMHGWEFWTADARFLRQLGANRPVWVRPPGVTVIRRSP